MGNLSDRAMQLANAPLEELPIDSRLARVLMRAGYKTLLEAFEDKPSKIRAVVTDRMFDEFSSLADNYEKNPRRFISLVEQKPKVGSARQTTHTQTRRPVVAHRAVPAQSRAARPSVEVDRTTPITSCYGELLSYQTRAKSVFDDLTDRYENVLVYQAFLRFSVELSEIRRLFLEYFSTNSDAPSKAISVSEKYLPDIFLIFIADLARDCFSDENLWGNFFKILPLDQIAQRDFKRAFVGILEKRGMPIYAHDETAHYFFYTTLLHGGLSRDSWEDLWNLSLIRMAQDLRKGRIGYGGEISGYSVLQEIKKENGRYSPKKTTVLRILQKASDSTIAPLFEAAIRVAAQAESSAGTQDEHVLLNGQGLPEAALVALQDVMEERGSRSHHRGQGTRGRKPGASQQREFVVLPSADLYLDLGRGAVLIRWTKKQYPSFFLDDRVDFYVDGEKCHEQYFEARLNKCILDDVEIEVSLRARYDIEIRLMGRIDTDEGIEFVQKGSLVQTFLRSKPGCFEFILGLDGSYRLRGRRDRITRTKQIAYVLKKGYYIRPGAGMTPVSTYEGSETWAGASVFVYDVSPGAAGSIFMTDACGDDKEVAVWQESYRVHINKERVIGETREGLDLYGHTYSRNGYNAGLPYITIEAADGAVAFDDLHIACSCDGQNISIPRKLLGMESMLGEPAPSQIALSLEDAFGISSHAELVEIVARQKSAEGTIVFRYRFAVVPLQEFRLAEAHIEYGAVISQYSFRAARGIYVTDTEGNSEFVGAHSQYWKRTLLKDEFMELVISSGDGEKTVNAKLALAAIEVTIPQELLSLSSKRPLSLADATSLGTRRGEIQIRSLGWRYNRSLIVALCSGGALKSVLCFKELRQSITSPINLFSDPGLFVPDNVEMRDCPLTLLVNYGSERTDNGFQIARTEVELLKCREGLGFKTYLLISTGTDFVVRFDEPVQCSVYVWFSQTKRRRYNLAQTSMAEGDLELPVPQEVARAIRTHRGVVMTLAPKSRFGKPRNEYAFDLPLGLPKRGE